MKMRLSSFGFVKDIDAIAREGFDCIEMHYREIIPMDEGEFRAACKKLKDSPLTAEVFNNPLPLDKQIIAPEFKLSDYREHILIGAERAAEMGARYCNFGNGRTRSLPKEGTDAELASARSKIVECIAEICEINAKYNITVLLEPLSPVVSNFILNVPEAIALAKELGVSNLKPFIDLRWFVDEKRSYDEIITYADQIEHIHIDNPLPAFPTRYIPRVTDEFDYTPFFDALKKICYKGIISCEANTFEDFEADLKSLMDFFRHYGISSYRL
jgi:sugar phosphate isomerase/epimerase